MCPGPSARGRRPVPGGTGRVRRRPAAKWDSGLPGAHRRRRVRITRFERVASRSRSGRSSQAELHPVMPRLGPWPACGSDRHRPGGLTIFNRALFQLSYRARVVPRGIEPRTASVWRMPAYPRAGTRVRKVGLEPTRPEGHRPLRPARLPISPLAHCSLPSCSSYCPNPWSPNMKAFDTLGRSCQLWAAAGARPLLGDLFKRHPSEASAVTERRGL